MIAGFELGCRAPLLVRRERVGTAAAAWQLLYASDLHLTKARAFLVEQLAAVAKAHRPDVVLLGGDLVDRQNGLPVLTEAVRALAGAAPVLVVAGNHDAWCGLDRVRDAIVAGGGQWLADRDVVMSRAGRRDLQLHAVAHASDPREALRVLVGHHPAIGERAAAHRYDVALAGHLHGGQCVWWERRGLLYPGAWLSRWNGLRFQLGTTTLLVSRGVADTLPVRFRCPREVVLCELSGEEL